MKSRHVLLQANLAAGVVLSLFGCTLGAEPAGDQPVLPAESATPSSSPTVDSAATQAAEATKLALSTLDAKSTQEAHNLSETAALKTQKMLDIQASATSLAGLELTSTAEFSLSATRQVEDFMAVIQQLFDSGTISTQEGEYYRLEDFDMRWAQLNFYDWWPTGYSAENFVMQGDAFVSSASDNANWYASACGVVFNLLDYENHVVVWIAMDGRAFLRTVHRDNPRYLEVKQWGKATKTEFEVQFRLVVSDKKVTLFIDDQQILSSYDGLLTSGQIANSMVSGTNKGYGTRCKMSNVDLWIIK